MEMLPCWLVSCICHGLVLYCVVTAVCGILQSTKPILSHFICLSLAAKCSLRNQCQCCCNTLYFTLISWADCLEIHEIYLSFRLYQNQSAESEVKFPDSPEILSFWYKVISHNVWYEHADPSALLIRWPAVRKLYKSRCVRCWSDG